MKYEIRGKTAAPALVCVPGLLGGPEDFGRMAPEWETLFRLVILDPNDERRGQGLNLTEESMREISFDSSAEEIAEILEQNGIQEAFLLGISLGGKIVYDFAQKYPGCFVGGLISDVGPGSFELSELYRFVIDLVENLDLGLAWPEMKKELASRIPDRNMRSLIQSQISYPNQAPPAVWKTGMKTFKTMLRRQSLDDQFPGLKRADAELEKKGAFIHVLKASSLSGIGIDSMAEIEKLKCIKVIPLPQTTHFLHITHRDLIVGKVVELMSPERRP